LARPSTDHLLLGAILAAMVLAAAALFGGGIYTSIGGVRISSRTIVRPLIMAFLFAIIWLRRSERRLLQLEQLWAATQRHANVVALCLALLVFVAALRVSPFEASGADAYGYVSQAELWVKGSLIKHEPLAAIAPWPEPEWTLSPLGYRPGPQPATIVPTYASGLPLVMAGLLKLFGPFGAFLAVPLLGSVAIFVAFLLGTRLAGSACGLMSAGLLLTSPVFLYQLKEPMSDVPVTAWWLLAILLVAMSTARSAFGAGLAASAAILTRPNLVPLAVVIAIFILTPSTAGVRERLRNALLFSLGVIPGCAGVALLNVTLYGSPLASGYGSMSELFRAGNFWPNLRLYARWFIETETPLVLLAPVAVMFLHGSERRLSWLFVAFSAALYACYAFYLPFDSWTYLRFLLPAIALILMLSAAGILHLSAWLSSSYAKAIVAGLFVLLLAWRWETTGLKPPPANERRYAVIGEYVRDQLPSNAILLSIIHSGSVRYYSGRSTLRWDWMPAEWLEPSLVFLRSNGYRPLLLIEDWERRQYMERFSTQSKLGSLDWPPIASYHGGVRADIFDPADRDRFLAGETIETGIIGDPPTTAKASAR
jgi:Dolichyl-phosphate-mannose-protein mannosyltransferase